MHIREHKGTQITGIKGFCHVCNNHIRKFQPFGLVYAHNADGIIQTAGTFQRCCSLLRCANAIQIPQKAGKADGPAPLILSGIMQEKRKILQSALAARHSGS